MDIITIGVKEVGIADGKGKKDSQRLRGIRRGLDIMGFRELVMWIGDTIQTP